MFRSGGLPEPYIPSITLCVLPTLVKLFSDTTDLYLSTIQERSIHYFSLLVSDNEDLQKASLDGDAISHLASILSHAPRIEDPLDVNEAPTRLALWNKTEQVCFSCLK